MSGTPSAEHASWSPLLCLLRQEGFLGIGCCVQALSSVWIEQKAAIANHSPCIYFHKRLKRKSWVMLQITGVEWLYRECLFLIFIFYFRLAKGCLLSLWETSTAGGSRQQVTIHISLQRPRAVNRAFRTLALNEYSMQTVLFLPPRLKSYIWHTTCRWQWLVYSIRSCATLTSSNKLFISKECQQLMSAWTVHKSSLLSGRMNLLLQTGTFICLLQIQIRAISPSFTFVKLFLLAGYNEVYTN